MSSGEGHAWTVEDSVRLYGVGRWGEGLLSADATGHLCLRAGDGLAPIDLKALVDEVRMRGLEPPVLLRFTDVLRQRLDTIAGAFREAMQEYAYTAPYRGVYPIKVNQHRHVLDDIVSLGAAHHYGLECGSKPELLIAMAHLADPEGLIVCNGFKDDDYIRMALSASRLGCRVFLVVEKLSELSAILRVAGKLGIDPLIGIRIKLSTSGQGRWESSGGEGSKFGLRADEIVQALRILKRRRKLHTLQLLHWHIGSQVPDIQCMKAALKEGTSYFIEIARAGAKIGFLDVGGGLAVDYDGTHATTASSANYTVSEYAYTVVDAVHTACEEAEFPHPVLITESGRSLVAYHAVLVLEAIAATGDGTDALPELPRRRADPVQRMVDILAEFDGTRYQETYHDAVEVYREAQALFSLRHLSLADRALTEQFFRAVCRRVHAHVQTERYVPEEMVELERFLRATYFCNFSLFQSIPDHWAIDQLFPVVPLHRLGEEPVVQGVLADITCDSDGVMKRFVDVPHERETLPLHPLREGEPYYLGVFLVGAYQEILGDLHNLFGDTNVVHVSAGNDGYVIDKTVEGETIMDVLDYVQYNRRDLLRQLRARVEISLRSGAMQLADSKPFMREVEESLDAYTYYRLGEGK